MPPVAVLAPILIPLVVAVLITGFGVLGVNLGRAAAGAGALGSALSLLVLWLAVRSTQELDLGALGFGSSVELRVDAVAFAFGLMVTLPAAVLLLLQPRAWAEAAMATLGLAAAMAAVEAGGMVLTALAGGTAAALAAVQLETESPDAQRPRWSWLLAAWLLLSLAGVVLQVRGGTDSYAAVPVASLTDAVFALLAAAALLASGLAPWRMWPSQLLMRPSSRAAGMAVTTLFPLGFYLLVRGYEMGNGRYPSPAFQVGLASLGAVIALAAAVRAQAAATPKEFVAEATMGFGGFCLMTLALGTPLGLAASLITLAAASMLVACIALLPDAGGGPSVAAIAAAVAFPPGLAFGARVLGLESTFEGGDFLGLIGIAGALAWVMWMIGGARALGLASANQPPAGWSLPRVAMGISLLTLVAGPALPAIQTVFANPAVAEVMPAQIGAAGGGVQTVVTVSTVLPALYLFTPLLVIGAIAYFFTGVQFEARRARPELFSVPGAALLARARETVRSATIPDEYRSLVDLRAIESAAVAGRPVLWLGALVALAFAVTR